MPALAIHWPAVEGDDGGTVALGLFLLRFFMGFRFLASSQCVRILTMFA